MLDIVNSAYGIQSDDLSPKALEARELKSLVNLMALSSLLTSKDLKIEMGKL